METTAKTWIVLVSLAVGLVGAATAVAQGTYGPDYNRPDYNQPDYGQSYDQSGGPVDFYDELGPYGQWVQTPEYGTVWIPNAGADFQPYATSGHWVVTEYGNTWVSDYAWGWAPFHYGRWYQDRYRGWAWIPGNDWGPAWVSWRSGGGYYGWAPLGPIQAGPGININVNVNIPANYWTFVPQRYITSPRLYSYCVPRPRVVNIYQNTTIINNVYRANNRTYAYGPRREEIEYVTRRSVPVYRIENTGRPGRTSIQNNTVGIYRPDMNRGGRGNGNPYANDPRNYQANPGSIRDNNAGGYSRNNPADGNQRYQQRGQSTPERGSRGTGYQQPNQPAQQPAQPYPQQDRSTAQPGQGYPQQERQRQQPDQQRQWSRGNRQESTPQAPQQRDDQPGSRQALEQRPAGAGGYDQRSQGQAQQVPPSSSPERRGGSRGPR